MNAGFQIPNKASQVFSAKLDSLVSSLNQVTPPVPAQPSK